MRFEALLKAGGASPNEDELLVCGRMAAVFDGATGLAPYQNDDGKTGGQIASQTAAGVFAEMRAESLHAAAIVANAAIRHRMESAGLNLQDRMQLWATTAAALRIGDAVAEYLTVGDALILAVMTDGRHALLTPHVNHDVPSLLLWRHLPIRITANERPEPLVESMRSVRRNANRTYGFLNGDPAASEFIRHGTLPIDGVHSFVLFTDGMQLPREDPTAEVSWEDFVSFYRQGGLTAVLRRVRALEDSDPECVRYPRLKRYDDAAAVAVILD